MVPRGQILTFHKIRGAHRMNPGGFGDLTFPVQEG